MREQIALVVGEQRERRLAIRPIEQQVREQPVGLRGRPARAVAEPGADQPRRRRGEHAEIEEHAERRRACEPSA